MHAVNKARKVGLIKWEADVEDGSIVYTFVGWTKASALRQAARFVIANHGGKK